jgi:hypothetical protein
MAAAELAFFVFFVAGALSGLLDLDFMMGKLRRSLREEVEVISPVAKGFTLVRAALAPPDSAYKRHCTRSRKASPSRPDVVC